jgi:hypothetical protein
MYISAAPDFRSWAARVARQAGEQRDPSEAQRLTNIAAYWTRLAEMDDWQRAMAPPAKAVRQADRRDSGI